MARSFIVYQGEDELPEFDLTEPTSDVHVIWEEIEAGGRAFQGESTTNSIPLRDQRGETGNELNLPSGMEFISISRGSRWVWMDGPDGDEVIMASGRIGTKDYSRGRQKADRAREVTIQAADRNEELTEIIIDDWVRPEETDVARVNALITDYLSGTPRATTVLSDTYVASGNTVTMPAKTYDGTNPKDVLSEIALQANKLFFVTIDDEVFYDTADSTVYQAGIRISDRIDEQDTEAVCSAGISGSVSSSGGTYANAGGETLPVTVASGMGGLYAVMITNDPPDEATSATYRPDLGEPGLDEPMTLIASVVHPTAANGTNQDNDTLHVFRLANPPASDVVSGAQIMFTGSSYGTGYGYWVVDSSAAPSVVTNSGTGTSSSVTTGAGAGDLVLDAAGWRIWSLGDVSQTPNATATQTEDWAIAGTASGGQNDAAWGGGSGTGLATVTWDLVTNTNWVAAAIVIPADEVSSAATFPPIWDVGPSSTEDGLELVSGLRLYYGQDGAYVYVNHAATANSYWWAERSFYTQDPAIDDATKATALANAMLTRLRFEERTYNVSIGPLNESQVGCIKYGQLIDIKARAIPDADDQFVSRRIAQLKWTTPLPGVFFARMQLDRPIKELPYGIGAKQGHDALEQHKEGDAHPASAIVITDSGGYFTGTDVEAALQELGALGPGAGGDTSIDDLITAHRLILWANRGDLANDGDSGDSYPENSLEGFVQAMVKGLDGIEVDVGASSNGTFHAMHDTTLDRTTDLTGNISSASDATLAGGVIDAGYGYNTSRHGSSIGIPTLAEIITACEPWQPLYLLELKSGTATSLAEFVVAQGIQSRTIITVPSVAEAEAVKAVSARIHTLMNEGSAGEGDDAVDWLSWDYNNVTSTAAVTATAPQRPHSYIPTAEFETADEDTILPLVVERGIRSWETYDATNALSLRGQILYPLSDSVLESAGYWEPVTNGDVGSPEIVFDNGDVVMEWVDG